MSNNKEIDSKKGKESISGDNPKKNGLTQKKIRIEISPKDKLLSIVHKIKNGNFIKEVENNIFNQEKKESNGDEQVLHVAILKSIHNLWNGKGHLFQITCFYQLIIIYLEVVFHLLTFQSLDGKILLPIVFAIPVGAVLGFISGIFGKQLNQVLIWIFTTALCLIFSTQLVYNYVFKTFLSIYSVGVVGKDVLEFFDQILAAIGNNLIGIFLLCTPLIILKILMKKKQIDMNSKPIGSQVTALTCFIVVQFFGVLILPIFGKETYSPYDIYHRTWVPEMSVEQLGVLTSTRFDVKRLIVKEAGTTLNTGLLLDNSPKTIAAGIKENKKDTVNNKNSKEKDVVKKAIPTPTPIDTSPNILAIDFEALSKEETKETVKMMHQYFASTEPTRKNKYTGMFKGYNLIMLTAEGFSPWAVDKEITPTLYKLIHEGFVFENFYTPLWWASTIDGEYVACTSLIPKSGVISFYESGSNIMPFALGNQFNKIGYSTRAYHNHTYTYYKRQISHPNMGYDYKGVGNGLEITESWPESDLEMIEVTMPEYIDDQPFHTYYMTVSGHMNYTFHGNQMSTKNKEAVDHLPYSMEGKAYIACNIELDRALERLIGELERKGIADKTVIALSADHYPYGLEKDKIDELAGHKVEENFELYKNQFILWSGSIKKPIFIDKPCSSLDIMPTLSNLFGLSYDSRLFMGKDILSDSPPLVIFSNRSFITDKVMYNSKTKEIIKLSEEELPEDYISTMNKIVNNKFLISESILDEDYYSYILSIIK
ncbi:MAG: sulfatase-like hydrolase/transferase [Anaerocolumna aminovalerica]|jgi:lipoteichoic acid synthase|uniref:LTA synthase family protein n=1 Tax=Anaerocolumna aminovalerica TaxID=1527 RepID=UPI00280BC233|nr:sulfatase-like hydrolase/transferase [Anaerocolumna aminovalerica]MDU6262977.1 sulfatase-like hydrolase/transferase [Anaerocolumna aminovalerica]